MTSHPHVAPAARCNECGASRAQPCGQAAKSIQNNLIRLSSDKHGKVIFLGLLVFSF